MMISVSCVIEVMSIDILNKSSMDDSPITTHQTTERETRQILVSKLIDMGFTDRQAQIALKRTKNDLHAAMDFLLTQLESIEDENEENEHDQHVEQEQQSIPEITPLFSRDGPFISFRQYRQQRFQPNPRVKHYFLNN